MTWQERFKSGRSFFGLNYKLAPAANKTTRANLQVLEWLQQRPV